MAESCPTIVELEAYLDVGSEVGIGPHVRECPDCRQRLSEMRANASFLADFSREAEQFRTARESATYGREFPAPPAGYTIRRVLGRGGQAVVYEAIQESTRRRVALKIVRLGARDAARRLRRFDREIELVSNLRHPLIVTVFDSGITTDGEPYLVMEYVEGVPIAYRAGAAVPETLAQFQQVCEAIRHAHQHGVVHRDLKPSNILIDGQDLPCVLDFGLATTVEPRESLALTRTGEFLGTPIYAAPEQLRSGAACADVRTDVYALGLILYELLTGAHPFAPHSGLADIVTGILEHEPDPPSAMARGLDEEIDTIVLKAIAKEPERRYASVDALHTDVGHYLRGEPIEAKRDSTWYTLRKVARRHRWAVAGGAGLLVVLIGFGALMSVLYRRASESSRQLAHALAARDLDRGLELARADDVVSAEPLLWGEYLKWTEDTASIAHWAQGPLLRRRAHWGLWALYQRQPCYATVKLGTERMCALEVEAPDSIVVTTGRAQIVRWNPRTGEQATLFGPVALEGPLDAVRVHRAAGRLVVAQASKMYCWDLHSMRLLNRWSMQDAGGSSSWSELARLKCGTAIATGHTDGSVRVWSLPDGRLRHTIEMLNVPVYTVILEDSSRVWAAGTRDGPFTTHDLDSGVTITSRENVWAGRLTLAPDGRLIHSRRIWSGVDERLVTDLEDTALARGYGWLFGASGNLVIGKGSTTPIWRADTGELLRILATYDGSPCALGADDRTLVTSHADGSVRAWDIAPDPASRRIRVSDTAHCVRFDTAGRRLVIAGSGPELQPFLRIVDVSDPTAPAVPSQLDHQTTIAAAAFFPNADVLATGCHDGVLATWRLDGDAPARQALTTLPAEVSDIAVSPGGDLIAAACGDSNVWLWRPADGSKRALEGHLGRVSSVAFSSDGSQLVSGSSDRRAILWDVASGTARRSFGPHAGPVRTVCRSADDRLIATAGDDQVIQLWDARDGRLLRRLAGHGARVFALAISPDGRLLASGDTTGELKLWDVESGTALASLRGHRHMVFSLDFGPAGDTLASGAADGSARLWDLRYYERHLAGNLAYQLGERTAASMSD